MRMASQQSFTTRRRRTPLLWLSTIHVVLLPLLLLLLLPWHHDTVVVAALPKISVVGSINADTFLPVSRFPVEGENLTCDGEPTCDVPGGKGCTQAIAASKLVVATREKKMNDDDNHEDGGIPRLRVAFGGRWGDDAVAESLRKVFEEARVDLTATSTAVGCASGRGYVFWASASGQVSAVVSGGSNRHGWHGWSEAWQAYQANPTVTTSVDEEIDKILDDDCQCLLLQREVPEYVNELLAAKAKQRRKNNILVVQDVGGEDRPITREHLQNCDYLIPNESELVRLVASLTGQSIDEIKRMQQQQQDNDDDGIVTLAKLLQAHGAQNVLVTQGSGGCTLVTVDGRQVYRQPAYCADRVVDETGAGDCFRAAFVVALLEGRPMEECLRWASAAGCLAVETHGAVPSTPTREAVVAKCQTAQAVQSLRGGQDKAYKQDSDDNGNGDEQFPFLIGSRLNSMKDRPELWDEGPLQSPRDYVKRQAKVPGLTCVDFNYPQHFGSHWTVAEAKAALEEAGFVAGAVCLRYPDEFARGAMNHPDPVMRRRAIELTKEAAQVALDLNCREVVVWSAYDGYDYPFQCDYDTKWRELVTAFQECCDAFPNVKFSVEYKPTDENTRFFTIPSTGAALLMVQHVDRPNFGLTLDVGHMLMSGENPGQSIAMAGSKLFGIQLNDGYTRLAAEDGLMFGSVHPSMALEIMYQLRRIGFDGHLYFDTFPQRSDPVQEAAYNIRRVKAFYKAAGRLLHEQQQRDKLQEIQNSHDAIGALELLDDALKHM